MIFSPEGLPEWTRSGGAHLCSPEQEARNHLVCDPVLFEIHNPLPDEMTMKNVKCKIKNEMKAGSGSS